MTDDEYGLGGPPDFMPPHEEEEWISDGRTLRLNADDAAHTLAVFEWHGADINLARARLAAQAPAMARLLLRLEWGGRHPHDGDPCCPSCKTDLVYNENETLVVGSHAPDCELAATLRAAGVLP